MGNDGIGSVYDPGIIPALVKHADVHTKKRGQENYPLGSTFVRSNEHHVIAVNRQIFILCQQRLCKLKRRRNIIHPHQRHYVLHTGIMHIEGKQRMHTHAFQFPKHRCAVQRFPGRFAMLPAFIKEGHNDGYPFRSAVARGNNAFQILVVIIRRHPVEHAGHLICQGRIAYIKQDINILVSDSFCYHTLCFPAAEPRAICRN